MRSHIRIVKMHAIGMGLLSRIRVVYGMRGPNLCTNLSVEMVLDPDCPANPNGGI